MEDNRTKWLILLGALVGVCVISLVCLVGAGLVGGTYFLRSNSDTGTVPVEGEQPDPGSGEMGGEGEGLPQEGVPPVVSKGSNELVLLGADPPTLDPALASDATSATYIVEMFSGLVTLDPELNVVPDIASSWVTNEDGTLYTFTLRDDVSFADGKAVTADDFKYSIERACDPATQSPVSDTYLGDIVGCRDKLRGTAGEVSGVRVVAPQTLEIQIDAPKVYFLAKLTYPTAFVVDRATVESEGRLWASSVPNGTGPFNLAEYSFGEQLVLEPNPNYYGDPKPSVERVSYILSGGSGMTMYETDELDVVGVGLSDLDRVLDPASELNADVREVEQFSIGYIGLNTQLPPFDDPLVRQAFNLAVDKDTLVNVVLRDTVTPAYSIIPPGMPGHSPDLQGLRFDVARAQALLTQSTYGGPDALPDITLHVTGAGGGAVSEQVEAIVEMWNQNLGVSVSIEQTEWATFLFDISRRPNPYQAFSIGWIADYPDPQNFLDIHFHCDSLDNRTGYCNPEVDALLEAARVEQDEAARMEVYRQAEERIVNEGAWVPLWFNKGYILVKPWVNDFLFPPTIVPTLKYITIEQ